MSVKSSESFAESCGYVCNIDDNSGNRCNFAKFYTKLAYKWVPGTLPAALNSLLPPYSKSYSSAENSSWKNWGKYIFPSFILRLLLLWWLRNNFSSQVTEKNSIPSSALPLGEEVFIRQWQIIPNMPWLFHVNEFVSFYYFCAVTDKFLSSPLEKNPFFFFFLSAVAILIWLN